MRGYEILLDELKKRKGEWTVSELMSTAVKTISDDSTISEAIHRMRDYGVHCLVVIKDNKPVGVVSTYDILLTILRKEQTKDVKVGDVMTTELITASPDEDAFEALERIMEHNVGRLIVLRDGKLIGIISSTDLIDAFDKSSGFKTPSGLSKVKSTYKVKEIRDILHEITTIGQDASVCEAAKLMDNKNIGSLLVTDEKDKFVGIITERDIFRKIIAQERDCKQIKVKSIMTEELFTIDAHDSIMEASKYFNKHQIRRLPVVEDGEIIGLISVRDVAKAIYLKRLL